MEVPAVWNKDENNLLYVDHLKMMGERSGRDDK
jgi:hypothetical protein